MRDCYWSHRLTKKIIDGATSLWVPDLNKNVHSLWWYCLYHIDFWLEHSLRMDSDEAQVVQVSHTRRHRRCRKGIPLDGEDRCTSTWIKHHIHLYWLLHNIGARHDGSAVCGETVSIFLSFFYFYFNRVLRLCRTQHLARWLVSTAREGPATVAY